MYNDSEIDEILEEISSDNAGNDYSREDFNIEDFSAKNTEETSKSEEFGAFMKSISDVKDDEIPKQSVSENIEYEDVSSYTENYVEEDNGQAPIEKKVNFSSVVGGLKSKITSILASAKKQEEIQEVSIGEEPQPIESDEEEKVENKTVEEPKVENTATVVLEESFEPTRYIDEKTRVDIPVQKETDEKTIVIPIRKKAPVVEEVEGQVVMPGFEDETSNTENKNEDNEWEQDLKARRKKKTEEFEFNKEEEKKETDEQEQTKTIHREDSNGEFCSFDDISSVKIDLIMRTRVIVRKIFITAIAFVLLCVGVFSDIMQLGALSVMESPFAYSLFNLIILAIVVVVNLNSFLGGLKSLLRRKPDLDSPMALCVLVALIQNVVVMIFNSNAQAFGVYSAAAVVVILINLLGKYFMLGRISDNFTQVSSESEKYCINVIDNKEVANELSREIVTGANIAFDVKKDIPEQYISYSFGEDSVDIAAQKYTKFIPIVGAIAFILALILGTKLECNRVIAALSVFSASIILTTPFTSLLSVNLLLRKKCQKLSTEGVVLPSAEFVDKFAGVQVVAVDAEELFPEGTVQLVNIKSSGTISLDRVLLDAAGVCLAAGGPLVSVFKSIIGDNTKLLPEVDSLIFEENMGLSGWVSGRRVLIGNRKLMDYHGVWVPDKDIIQRYETDGIYTVFLSDSGMMSAIFFVKYSADEELKYALQDAVKKGIRFSVCSVDPNVNENMINRIFDLPEHAITVMKRNDRELYKKSIEETEGTGKSKLLHLFDAGSFASAIIYCKEIAKKISLLSIIQKIMMLCGVILSLICVITCGSILIGVKFVLAFQLLWAAIVFLYDLLY